MRIRVVFPHTPRDPRRMRRPRERVFPGGAPPAPSAKRSRRRLRRGIPLRRAALELFDDWRFCMRKPSMRRWVFIGGLIAFWMVVGALFGVANVRAGLRLFTLLVILLSLLVLAVDKAYVAVRTRQARELTGDKADGTSNETAQVYAGSAGATGKRSLRTAFHPVVNRSEDGRLADGWVVGFVQEGTKGYARRLDLGTFATPEEAQKKADELNRQNGLSSWKVNRMINRWR